ncbi:MAG TPA: hypothetical protein PKC24_06645 [Cyclobacteriaceae bacterium]|nr:hypothetical protein [Cyclobacteriaceae bacterium]
MRRILLTCTLALILLLAACSKEEITCDRDTAFCTLINQENYTETHSITNAFLTEMDQDLTHEEQLDLLVEWLQCKTCVSAAELSCNSCLWSLPPISIIKVKLKVKGQLVEKRLHISMSEPLWASSLRD